MNRKQIIPLLTSLCLSSNVGACPPEKSEEGGSGPIHPKTEEAVRKALESVEGYGPEGLRVHPESSKKGTKVDTSTSGPIHPDTEENARKALEAIHDKALEGLRVHPEDPNKGAKFDPTKNGQVDPAGENPEGETVMVEALPGGLQPRVLAHKTFSSNKQMFAGSYLDGWEEVISIHDAKSGKQIKRII